MWLEVWQFVLFEWRRHSRSTYDTWSFGWDNQFSLPKITKKFPKSIKHPLNIDLWTLLGSPLEPLWNLLGSILAKCVQKIGFWRFWEGSWEPKTTNLAPIPCAAHVPPRCRVVMKSSKWMPAGIFCNNPCTMSKKALTAMQKTCSVAVCGMFRSL